MNILMMTNTFTPHVGGVARSVETFAAEFRRLGHNVLVVAPEFEGAPEEEPGVIRVLAIQNFNNSDFSVSLPILDLITLALDDFKPDIVHSHHPFLLGDTAYRIAAREGLPLVFTHHTMYERYTHYMPADSPVMRRFVVSLDTSYCNLCDHVIAPSQSVADILVERGVKTPITAIATGIDTERFASGVGARMRERLGIPPDAFVVGHVGRLAAEKNLPFLARAVGAFLWRNPESRFLIGGSGPEEAEIVDFFKREGLAERVHFAGVLRGQDLADAYRAMNVFAFASHTETQGLVIAEALAAGVPAVALDATGVRDVLRDGVNGRLVPQEGMFAFASALHEVAALPAETFAAMKSAAIASAAELSQTACARQVLALYESLAERNPIPRGENDTPWASAIRVIRKELGHWQSIAEAAGSALLSGITGDSENND